MGGLRGETCGDDGQCLSTLRCNTVTRKCSKPTLGNAGDACSDNTVTCLTGSCSRRTGTCPQMLADGAACDPTDDSRRCGPHSYCFGGQCTPEDPALRK